MSDEPEEAQPVRRKQRHLVTEVLNENEELSDRLRQLDQQNDQLRAEKEALEAQLAAVTDDMVSSRSRRKKATREVEKINFGAQPSEAADFGTTRTREALSIAKLDLEERG